MSLSQAERLAQRRQLLVLDASLARWRLASDVRQLAHEADPRVLAGRAFDRTFERVRQRPAVLVPILLRLALLLNKRRNDQTNAQC